MDELRAIAILGTELIIQLGVRISVPAVITPGQAIVLAIGFLLGGGFVLTYLIKLANRSRE